MPGHRRYVICLAEGIMGVLWLPTYMANTSVAKGELVRLFKDSQLEVMPMFVGYAPNCHISFKLRVFIDWIVELMAGYGAQIAH
ncbi:hypothetical protein EJJ20_05190 [Pseudomonas poae]|nr:hypothetical protein EJJ20_05190 [Pseudomonas poae]